VARTFYDSLSINEDIELDLSMLEATGGLLHDESKNHSTATQHAAIGVPLWMQLASGRYGISINQLPQIVLTLILLLLITAWLYGSIGLLPVRHSF